MSNFARLCDRMTCNFDSGRSWGSHMGFYQWKVAWLQVEVVKVGSRGDKPIGRVPCSPSTTLADLKPAIQRLDKRLGPTRQSLRLEPKGKAPKQDAMLSSLGVHSGAKIYVKDLGPQIGWKTVFLVEYAGPLVVYLWMFQRPWLFYGSVNTDFSLTTK